MADVTPDENRRRDPEPGPKGIRGERTGEGLDERRIPGTGTEPHRTKGASTPGGLGAGAEDIPARGTRGTASQGTVPDTGTAGIPEEHEHGTPLGGRPVSGGAVGRKTTTSTGTPSVAPHADEEARLLSHDEADKLALQLHHAVAGFVDGPRAAVEEADHVLEEVAARFTEAVTRRRRTLRGAWQSAEAGEDKPVTSTDTEQLRLALRDYRELAERLLRV
ncbi:hypothetical protein [Streptomyces griseus]|uniref:hypothetical protein n=1 Tax=Streptomyces griseus TaxID=1911 RepID=UPI0007C6A4C1|nr:hypothetical protein [Streptomyces griseus]